MAHPFIPASLLSAMALAIAACGPRPSLVASPSVPVAAQPAPASPSIDIAAPGARVRAVIAARAQSRGTTVASNTPQGVVLERDLSQSPEALEAQCGPHRDGRKIRVVLSTQEGLTGTRVTEQRFIIDGSDVCPVTLTADEVTQANASLQDTRNQVLGAQTPRVGAGGQPVAPATPRT